MTATNFERALQAFWDRRPFQAFTVELVSGRKLRVDHPEAVVLRGRVAMYISPGGRYHLFDHQSVCRAFDLPDDSDVS